MKSTAQLSIAKQMLLDRYCMGLSSSVPGARLCPRPRGANTPLSFAQEQLYWRELRLRGIPPIYNECITVRMLGSLDVQILERAFNEIVRRHEIWRTTFETEAGRPLQIVRPFEPLNFAHIDVRELPQAKREAEAVCIIREQSKRPFKLDCGPLLRPTLVRMSDSEYRLYVVAHQIILDGVSAYQIFPSELATIYHSFAKGDCCPLPELSIQYGDFAYWQRDTLQEQWPKQIAYWRDRFADEFPETPWPTKNPHASMSSFRGSIESFAFPASLGHGIKQLARSLNTTPFLVLVCGLAIVLHQRGGQRIVSIGTPAPAGRKRSEVMGLLGYFLNPVALTFNFSYRPSFAELIAEMGMVMAEALSNDDVPIECLARQLKCQDVTMPSPFFTLAVSMQPRQPELGLSWTVTSMDFGNGGSPWGLYVAFIETADTIIGRVQFNSDLFDQSVVHELWQELQMFLKNEVSQTFAAKT